MPQPVSGQAPDAQGKATLAHISVFLTWIGLAAVAVILMVVVAIVVGIWGIAAFVCHIIGAVKANAGETDYKYPLPSLKILKD